MIEMDPAWRVIAVLGAVLFIPVLCAAGRVVQRVQAWRGSRLHRRWRP
ncbi:MAG TPA: hypothetical protein VGX25_03940 [Actinophytocola sp.]|nr:hypothetical protein [Actinophytocola sp.]HEV2778529.1 hypothetical protein [Actinophytocola sp.]